MIPEANAAVDAMIDLVEQKAKELADLKRATNVMCRQLRRPEIYDEVEETVVGGMVRLKPDQFYGKTPIIAAREYLDMRHEAVRVEEILEALVRGGFDFAAQNWPQKERFRLLALSLSKNSVIFHKLPNGMYGLLKWYPDRERDRNEGAGKLEPKKVQTKVPTKEQAANSSAKPAPPSQAKRAPTSAEAIQRAVADLRGQFTIDDVLPNLEENERDRAVVRTELNRLAKEKASGVLLVKKGALKKPAVYERADRAAGHEGGA
jgi:hypothetical protein